MYASSSACSLVIPKVSLVLFNMVFCMLLVGAFTSLSAGSSIAEARLDSAGIGFGLLTSYIFKEPTPSCFVTYFHIVYWLLVLSA